MAVESPGSEGGSVSRTAAKTTQAVALPAPQMPPNGNHNACKGSGAAGGSY